MKPRIFKKLCKRVYEIGGDQFGKAWLDDEPGFASYYLTGHDDSNMSHLWVTGGERDYWGEAEDPVPLYRAAWEFVLWEFGEPVMAEMKDHDGNLIDEVPDWPIYKKRLTGKEVIQKLRQHRGDTAHA